MDTENTSDGELIARLRRLDASASPAAPGFDYPALLERHAIKTARARRRLAIARGTASALVVALVGASVWRFVVPSTPLDQMATAPALQADALDPQPRIVRADTYLAVAALEDHIASLDDALNVARLREGPAEVARLERTRAELLDSYAQVRYAELVSANF
jgi:hypothetical protein